ncbi:hypothetical protein [Chromohalobacter sp. HP20-39]|uniref:hypothetical protein n=1 Tax=Chromohalobacter sp. HP20-39 TaxID=3079306 RepID=UPI00294B50DD|nr:hypothetical protein [Chromohalobacter sp. HP20-39]MDV6318675.1 hypothetical protein [Chromohalobacter sp. HP20-39]
MKAISAEDNLRLVKVTLSGENAANMSSQATATIAKVKKASPSRGMMREGFYPSDTVKSYSPGGRRAYQYSPMLIFPGA